MAVLISSHLYLLNPIKLVQYDDSGSGGEREKSKSIDLTDMTSVFLQPMESLPKGADPRAALHVSFKINSPKCFKKTQNYFFE